jgi:spore coat polysaccharide biosynthesis protein SpsF
VKIAIIIQARMGSSRLPGKVLLPVRGKPLLQYLLDRLESANLGLPIVIATSREPADQLIVDFCAQQAIDCYRGSHLDVASRFADVIDAYRLDAFVRINGDSPLLDGSILKQAMEMLDGAVDLVTNIYPRSYPRGQSVEILRAACFKDNLPRMVSESDREHVTPFFYRNAGRFQIRNLLLKPSLADTSMAVDTPKDLERFRQLIGTTGDNWVKLSFPQLLDRFQKDVPQEGLRA